MGFWWLLVGMATCMEPVIGFVLIVATLIARSEMM